MSVIEKVGKFLNTLTMQYKLRYKWWINAVVMILYVPHCLCWLFYFQNIIMFLFEKLSCAVEILIWSDTVDFLTRLLGMPYSVVTAQQACSTEMVKLYKRYASFGLSFSEKVLENHLLSRWECLISIHVKNYEPCDRACWQSSFDSSPCETVLLIGLLVKHVI